MERLGIVGLPNSGKSSLFNALTGMGVEVAAHPFTTTGSNVGVAQVPDERLETLARLASSQKVVRAGLHVVDIAGLSKGASGGEGLGNSFLGQIRECDAILYCLRAFEDANVVYTSDPPDPVDDLETLEMELCIADLDAVEVRLPKMAKASIQDASKKPTVAAMERAKDILVGGTPLYRSDLTADERGALRDLFLLTNKKVLYVVNIGEEQLGAEDDLCARITGAVGADAIVAAVCASLEAEVAEVDDPAERAELLSGYGVTESALPRVARAAYTALGKQTFLTTGDKESRAWTVRAGATAPEAAGAIHSDLQRGFIRAEVCAYQDCVDAGGWDEAKKAGKVRLEGKEYIVADGDVLEIRFNV